MSGGPTPDQEGPLEPRSDEPVEAASASADEPEEAASADEPVEAAEAAGAEPDSSMEGEGEEAEDIDVELDLAGVLAGDPLAVELADARKERDDYLDALRRLQADFENYRKRIDKQQSDTVRRAAEGLVEKLLPALDTADLALAHTASPEVEQVRAALLDVLQREGLERIDLAGQPFDPTVHDAVAHEPAEGKQEVAEVLRAGYVWKGRVLRPAMVKVRG